MATDNVGLKSNLIQAIYKGFYVLLLRGGVGGSLDSFGCTWIQFKVGGGTVGRRPHSPGFAVGIPTHRNDNM